MKKLMSYLLCFVLVLTSIGIINVKADSAKIVTLGADLTEDQRQTILNFFGIKDENSVEIITITNADEHEVLDGLVDDSVIGTHTYSCAYIEPTQAGGINCRTANLNYVTSASLINALMTAGIENCNLLVTAPFEVSGTGALTGVFKAYEQKGIVLDTDKQELAAEELVLNSDLEQEYGEDINEVITAVKEEVVKSDKDLSEEELRNIVVNNSVNFNINISDENIGKIVAMLEKLQGMNYSADAFTNRLDELASSVKQIADDNKENIDGVKGFFAKIIEWFKNFLGFNKDSNVEETTESSIFDNINTDIFKYDDTDETTEQSEEVTEESIENTVESNENVEESTNVETIVD